MKKYYLAMTAAFFVAISPLLSQCSFIPVDLSVRVSSSDLIVEATLTEQISFINDEDALIYTANYLQVHKVFKGDVLENEIVLISPGGYIDGQGQNVQPSIYVKTGMNGLFFLYNSNVEGDAALKNYRPFSGPQACIYYNEATGTANDAFQVYNSVAEVYEIIQALTAENTREITKVDFTQPVTNDKTSTIITELVPNEVVAGVNFLMNIKGKEFGSVKGSGYVMFTNASTGPTWVSPAESQYIFWSDTLIKVLVPSGAGSGAVGVQQNGLALTSGLTIRFSQLNYDDQRGNVIPAFHKDNNGDGGFTWEMSNQYFNNNGAKNSTERALATWYDQTCINWENGPATVRNPDREDGVNNIRFGSTGELESGVLAHTRNYWTSCGSLTAYTKEIDLTFDPDIPWNVGSGSPGFGEYDIESVAVHELGHAHQLGHVIDLADFMHATIGPGQSKRNLVDNNVEAGLYVTKFSAATAPCGPAPMIGRSGCNLPLSVELNEETVDLNIYPNPFSGVLTFENHTNTALSIGIYNLLGDRVDAFIISENQVSFAWTADKNLPNGLYFVKNEFNGNLVSKAVLAR